MSVEWKYLIIVLLGFQATNCIASSLLNRLSPIFYDDSYITKQLDDRYHYLKLDNGSYIGPRDYFNFSELHEPSLQHLEEVNLEQHLYEEIKSMEITSAIATFDQWYYTDETIESQLDGQADEDRCRRELIYLADKTRRADNDSGFLFRKGYKNHHLLKLLDTWGRPPSETYFGNSFWTGSYRGCKLLGELASKFNVKASSLHIGTGNLEYRYCWAKLRAKDWPEIDEMIPPTSIRVGVCLPDSCNSRLANKYKTLLLDIMSFNFSPMHRSRYNKIIHVYCLPRKTLNQVESTSGLIFRTLVTSWLVAVVLSSLASSYLGKNNIPELMNYLTVQENYRRYAADDEARPESPQLGRSSIMIDLRPIGIARLATTVIVCIAHCVCTFGWISKSSTFNMIVGRSPIYSLVIPSMKSNEIFWLISGLLTSYTIMSRFKREQLLRPTVYAGIILARYLRLACIQVLVLSFIKTVYLSLGEGPYWDYGTYKYSLQSQCQQSSWWRVLLLPILFDTRKGNNYLHECLPVTWHIVADLKLSLAVPALVYLLATNSSLKRWLLLGTISIVSLVSQYNDLSRQRIIYFRQFYRYSQSVALNMLSLAFGETGYFNIYSRLFPLTVGMIAGIYLQERKNQSSWPKWMKGWYFLAIIAYQIYDCVASVMAQVRYLNHGELPDENVIKWAMLLKPRLDCIMFAIIFVRMASDLAPQVMLHAKSFYKLSKISYCVLLVHPMVIAYLVNADESGRMDMFSTELLRLIVGCISLSYLIAFPLYILFESPLALLSGRLFKRQHRAGSGKQSRQDSGKLD